MTQPAATPEQEVQAMELRKAGATFAQIAMQLRLDADDAEMLVADALAREYPQAPDEATALEMLRLDGMLVGLWPKARAGDTRATSMTLQLLKRKRALGFEETT